MIFLPLVDIDVCGFVGVNLHSTNWIEEIVNWFVDLQLVHGNRMQHILKCELTHKSKLWLWYA